MSAALRLFLVVLAVAVATLALVSGKSGVASKKKRAATAVVPSTKRSQKSRRHANSGMLHRSFLEIYDTIANELKRYGSSEFENVLLKATSPRDTRKPKKKYISSIITAVKEYNQSYDDLDLLALILHKLHIKANNRDWRRRLKAMNILHVLFRSLSGSSSVRRTSVVLREKLRKISRSYCSRTACNYYCYKQFKDLASAEHKMDIERNIVANKTPRRFMTAYAKYCLFRCARCSSDFSVAKDVDDDDNSDDIESFVKAATELLPLFMNINLDRDDCSELAVYCLFQTSRDAELVSCEISAAILSSAEASPQMTAFRELYSRAQDGLLAWVKKANKILVDYDYSPMSADTFAWGRPSALFAEQQQGAESDVYKMF